jgi:hypothetical protein
MRINSNLNRKGVGDMLKSRNALLTSAIMFLIIVIVLRLMSGVFEDSFLGIINLTLGDKAEGVPLIDWSSLSWMILANWSLDGLSESVNGWVHDMVDAILPAGMLMLEATTLHAIALMRAETAGAIMNVGRWMLP